MPLWNNNDREESKPLWLTPAQKRYCVRTVRGWEVPVSDGNANVAGQFEGVKGLSAHNKVTLTEVLVAMPLDPSFTTWTNRGTTGAFAGGTAADTPNYAPYITCPFNSDTALTGGLNGKGLSHSSTTNYGLNEYGVSTLMWGVANIGMSGQATGYIKIVANDFNQTNELVLGCTMGTREQQNGLTFFTGTDLNDTTKVPLAVYESFFGPTSQNNTNIGVLRIAGGTSSAGSSGPTSGTYSFTITVRDGVNSAGGQLAGSNSVFNITVR